MLQEIPPAEIIDQDAPINYVLTVAGWEVETPVPYLPVWAELYSR